MTSRNGYFPGKTKAKRSAIIAPRTAQETQIAAMPRQSRAARQALAKTPPLRVGGDGLVEGADRIMRTPTEHQAAGDVADSERPRLDAENVQIENVICDKDGAEPVQRPLLPAL